MKIPVSWVAVAAATLFVAHYLVRVDEADARSVVDILPDTGFVAAEPTAFYAVNPDAGASSPEYLCSMVVPAANVIHSPPRSVRIVNVWAQAVPLAENIVGWDSAGGVGFWPRTSLELTYRHKYLLPPETAPRIPCEALMISEFEDGMVICQVKSVFVSETDEPIGLSFRRKAFVPKRDGAGTSSPNCPLIVLKKTWKANWAVVVPESIETDPETAAN